MNKGNREFHELAGKVDGYNMIISKEDPFH